MWENEGVVPRLAEEYSMELNRAETDLFAAYLSSFTPLAGDRRTAQLLGETGRGIIANESRCCSRLAPFPPAPRREPARGEGDPAHGGRRDDDPLPLRCRRRAGAV